MPIFDLINIYNNHYLEFDFTELLDIYLSKYPLSKEELILFLTIISIPKKIKNSNSEYKNVLKHTTIELIHTPNGLKENIILDKYIENYSFSYILETSLNLIYEQDTLYLYNKA